MIHLQRQACQTPCPGSPPGWNVPSQAGALPSQASRICATAPGSACARFTSIRPRGTTWCWRRWKTGINGILRGSSTTCRPRHSLALDAILTRVGGWMASEASHGCLFHAAVAADPESDRLRSLLESHKDEVAARAAAATGLRGYETQLLVIIEGLTQAWPLRGDSAVDAARHLARCLPAEAVQTE